MGDVEEPDEARLAEIARRLGNPDWAHSVDFLSNPVVRGLAKATGIDLSEAEALFQSARQDMAGLDRAAQILGPLGWAVSGRLLTPDDYRAALAAWDNEGEADAVDAVLVPPWRDELILRRCYGPMFPLADEDARDEVFDLLFARQRILDLAKGYHLSGGYEASVLLVLTQVDGLTYDWNVRADTKRVGFFEGKGETFEDDQTIAGLSPVLATVRGVIGQDVTRSTLDPALRRHGVFHGRVVTFGTEANSARAFALLGAVIDWLRAKTDAARAAKTKAGLR